MMFVTVVSSAALLTPVATPANLMVMGPGGYRFGDYAKLGLPLLAWYFVVSSASSRCSGSSEDVAIAFPGHAGRGWPIARWRSLARNRGRRLFALTASRGA